jgi:hypothetical protein
LLARARARSWRRDIARQYTVVTTTIRTMRHCKRTSLHLDVVARTSSPFRASLLSSPRRSRVSPNLGRHAAVHSCSNVIRPSDLRRNYAAGCRPIHRAALPDPEFA